LTFETQCVGVCCLLVGTPVRFDIDSLLLVHRSLPPRSVCAVRNTMFFRGATNCSRIRLILPCDAGGIGEFWSMYNAIGLEAHIITERVLHVD